MAAPGSAPGFEPLVKIKLTPFQEFLIEFLLSWMIGPLIMGAVYETVIWLVLHGYFGP